MAMSGDIFDCHNWEQCNYRLVGQRDEFSTVGRAAPSQLNTKDKMDQNVNSTKMERPFVRLKAP